MHTRWLRDVAGLAKFEYKQYNKVFDAGTSNTLKDFQTRICRMQQLEDGNRMKYSDKMPEDLGYLERTTIHPGEVVSRIGWWSVSEYLE